MFQDGFWVEPAHKFWQPERDKHSKHAVVFEAAAADTNSIGPRGGGATGKARVLDHRLRRCRHIVEKLGRLDHAAPPRQSSVCIRPGSEYRLSVFGSPELFFGKTGSQGVGGKVSPWLTGVQM